MADLKITGLHKYYGSVHAVKGVDLEIPAGEFTVLVGQSGCGKSTLLRTIAGLEEADGGTIEIGGRVVFPMARTGLFATAVFTFVFAWNDFLFALVLTRTEVITYTVQVTHYFGGQSNFWAKIAAMSVLGTVPVFFTVATLQRYLVRGISMGAVKG